MRKAADGPPAGGFLKVVIVDDDEAIVKLLSLIVRTNPAAEPVGFSSSDDALIWLAKHEADLVFVDYQMPEPDGLAFLTSLRALPSHAALPVVMVSGSAHEMVRRRAEALGTVGFVDKPVSIAAISAHVTRTLERGRSRGAA